MSKEERKEVRKDIEVFVTVSLIPDEDEDGNACWNLYIDDDLYDGLTIPGDVDPDEVFQLIELYGYDFYSFVPEEWSE